jgi:ABC-2 type transport system permease protein
VERLFRRGEADIAVAFEPGFADRLAAGTPARIVLIGDASDPNTGSTVQAQAGAVIAAWQAELGRVAGAVTIVATTRMRFNPTLESVNLFVPGLIALVLTLVSALMTAISLSREKERGTLEVLLVSPLRPWQIIVGKVLPYLGLGFAITCLVLLAARIVFGVPVRGSVTLLLAESVLYTIVSLALGVLVAARTTSQRAAMLGALVGTMMPTALLSGMIFPIASMPAWLQPVTNVVPARWFIVIARGIMLKGVGLGYLWHETAVLAGMALLLLVTATRSFHARLD